MGFDFGFISTYYMDLVARQWMPETVDDDCESSEEAC